MSDTDELSDTACQAGKEADQADQAEPPAGQDGKAACAPRPKRRPQRLNMRPDQEVGAPVVQISGLWTKFGRTVVHQDLNLEIFAGEILTLVGGSGTGKTVLLRQMLGLETPARGCVRVFGEDISEADAEQLQRMRNHWGMLFQQGALYSALTVFDNIAQPLRELRALPEDVIYDAVMLKMNMVGLGIEHANKMPSDLSGGMVKRAALARSLALEPQLLFLDEPTAGLDPDLSDAFVALIQSLHRELGLTVVMVTHDLDTLFALSTRVAVLAEKYVIAVGPTRNVLAVDHPFIKQFFLGARGQRALEVLDEYDAEHEHDHDDDDDDDDAEPAAKPAAGHDIASAGGRAVANTTAQETEK